VLSLDLGYTAPMWVGATLALVGSGLALVVRRVDRREAAHVSADVVRWREQVGDRLDAAA
jgi:DHA1 family inner membrane transport protein